MTLNFNLGILFMSLLRNAMALAALIAYFMGEQTLAIPLAALAFYIRLDYIFDAVRESRSIGVYVHMPVPPETLPLVKIGEQP